MSDESLVHATAKRTGAAPADPAAAPPVDQLSVGLREQWWYARLLWWSGSISLALLALGFFVFLAELLPHFIGVDLLPDAWALSAQELRQRHGHPAGWEWLRMLGHGDILNLLGIALLASCSAVPLAAVTALYWLRRERLYAVFAGLQLIVLAAAASGLLATGH